MTDELIEQVAMQVSEPVFILTRDACLKQIVMAKRIAEKSSLYSKYPELAKHMDGIFDAISVMVSETLLTEDIVRHAADVLRPYMTSKKSTAYTQGWNEAIEAAADWFADRFSDAVQADCESGVKWLNERAAKAYLKDAPDTLAAIREGEEAIRALTKDSTS